MTDKSPDLVEDLVPTETALAVQTVAIDRAPELVLAEAHRAAKALKDVLDNKPRKVMFNNEQYLEAEDWQTVGRFYGITAKEDGDAEYVDYGEMPGKGQVHGFKASAVALGRDGLVISRATAYCMTDEEKWRSRPKYEWRESTGRGREKVHIGDEPVPMFQLASMAQTRACAKVLRNVLAWVVVLAGYRPTPSEELDRAEETANAKPAGRSKTKAAAEAEPTEPTGDKRIVKGAAVTVKEVEIGKRGQKADGKPYTRYIVHLSDGRKPATFDDDLATLAETFKMHQTLVLASITKKGEYLNLMGLERADGVEGPPTDQTPPMATAPAQPISRGPDVAGSQVPPGQAQESFTVTGVKEWRNDKGIANRWAIVTKELGDQEFIETTDKALAKAAFQAKLDGNRVELVFKTVKVAGDLAKRYLIELAIVRSQPSEPADFEAEMVDGELR